jgi:hypothetical protein
MTLVDKLFEGVCPPGSWLDFRQKNVGIYTVFLSLYHRFPNKLLGMNINARHRTSLLERIEVLRDHHGEEVMLPDALVGSLAESLP